MKANSVSLVITHLNTGVTELVTVYRQIKGIDKENMNEMFNFYQDTTRSTRLTDYRLLIDVKTAPLKPFLKQNTPTKTAGITYIF